MQSANAAPCTMTETSGLDALRAPHGPAEAWRESRTTLVLRPNPLTKLPGKVVRRPSCFPARSCHLPCVKARYRFAARRPERARLRRILTSPHARSVVPDARFPGDHFRIGRPGDVPRLHRHRRNHAAQLRRLHRSVPTGDIRTLRRERRHCPPVQTLPQAEARLCRSNPLATNTGSCFLPMVRYRRGRNRSRRPMSIATYGFGGMPRISRLPLRGHCQWRRIQGKCYFAHLRAKKFLPASKEI